MTAPMALLSYHIAPCHVKRCVARCFPTGICPLLHLVLPCQHPQLIMIAITQAWPAVSCLQAESQSQQMNETGMQETQAREGASTHRKSKSAGPLGVAQTAASPPGLISASPAAATVAASTPVYARTTVSFHPPLCSPTHYQANAIAHVTRLSKVGLQAEFYGKALPGHV